MLNCNRLYGLIAVLTTAAYGLLGYLHFFRSGGVSIDMCPLHQTFNIPCPSCGTTRSVLMLMEGNLQAAIMTNPLGLLAASMLVILPAWMATDLIRRRDTLYRNFRMTEKWLVRNKWIMFLLVTLVLANWIWNIFKGL